MSDSTPAIPADYADEVENGERDARGRFRPGCRGGPGRKPLAVEKRYHRALTKKLTRRYWDAIINRAIADAIKGDWRARDFLARYCLRPMGPTPSPTVAIQNNVGIGRDNQGQIGPDEIIYKSLSPNEEDSIRVRINGDDSLNQLPALPGAHEGDE